MFGRAMPMICHQILLGWLLTPLVPQCFSQGDIYQVTEKDVKIRDFTLPGYPKPGDIPLLNRKIVRGRRVSIIEHPYIVSIRRNIVHYLTGTLIAQRIVLTVAHPLVEVPTEELAVVVGQNYADRGGVLLTVVAVIVPELFSVYTLKDNLALLLLYQNVDTKISIKTVPLVVNSFEYMAKGYTGFVTGWGRCDVTGEELCLPRSSAYYPDERQDPMLKTVTLDVATSEACRAYVNHRLKLQEDMICMGEARQDSHPAQCLGVPGAPLVLDGSLLALLSWGFGCGYAYDMPLVYVNLTYHYSWLTHNLGVLRQWNSDTMWLLYQATRSAHYLEYLNVTRYLPVRGFLPHNYVMPKMVPTPIDIFLAKFRGNVWDIRDYTDNGAYRLSKRNMLMELRNQLY